MSPSFRAPALRALVLPLLAVPLPGQGAVRELRVQLFPGGYLDLETGVVLSVERFGDARADLALKGLALPGKVAPDGMQQLEPVGGAKLARLPLSSRAEVEKLYTLPVEGLRELPEPLGAGGGFAMLTAEGHYARLWLRALPSGAVEVEAAVEEAGIPRFAPPPVGLVVEAAEGARNLRWGALPGARYHLVRRPFGSAGDASGAATAPLELDVEGAAHIDRDADPARCYLYEVAAQLGEGRRGLAARVLALPEGKVAGEPWRARVGNGAEIDLYEATAAGSSVHLRVLQIYDSGLQIEPGSGGSILDGRFAQTEDGAVRVGEDGFVVQQLFLQPEGEAFVRTQEGLLGRARLVRLGGKGRGGYEAELEFELAPLGADGFLRAPEAPRLEWREGRVHAEWKRPAAARVSELGRRTSGGKIERLPVPPDALRFEDAPPAELLSAEYFVRAIDERGRRSPWSSPVSVVLVDPADGPRLRKLVQESVRALASEHDATREEGERRLRLLGSLAVEALQELAAAGGETGEVATQLLRELASSDATSGSADAAGGEARARLQLELRALPASLRAVALEERRGARLFGALLGGAHGDPEDEDHAALRRALASGDPDGLLRRAIETWTRQSEGDWSGASFAAEGSALEVPFARYDFDGAEIEQRLNSAGGAQRAQVARWVAAWASPHAPAEAWALLTWAELLSADDRAEWPLVRAGLELLAGRSLGSREGQRAVRLAELCGERARCRALARVGALLAAPFALERTVVVTPEEGLAGLVAALQRAEPGTRLVLEPGRYEDDIAQGPIALRGTRVRIEAREAGAVTIAAPLLVEDARELVLAGLVLAGAQGYGLQVMRSTCLIEDVRVEGASAGLHFADAFVWLRGCRLNGRPNATGILLREGGLGLERCLVDGFQIGVQAQGRAQVFCSRTVFADLAFAVARGNGEGSSLYADRCAALGSARQVFVNFPHGAAARLLLAGVGTPGTSLGEGFAVDGSTYVEIDGTAPSQWGGAKLQAGVATWFDAR